MALASDTDGFNLFHHSFRRDIPLFAAIVFVKLDDFTEGLDFFSALAAIAIIAACDGMEPGL